MKCMSKIRIGAHKLASEVGRHRRPVKLRVCEQYEDGSVEDESHFIMKCRNFEGHRKNLCTKRYAKRVLCHDGWDEDKKNQLLDVLWGWGWRNS